MFEKDTIFWGSALAGSGMFLIQFLLNFVVGDADDSHNFKWLSKQALTGFLMMFGWIGLACKRELGISAAGSTLIAVAAGVAAMFITGLVFKTARKLRSSGTVFRIDEAIGKEASVYQRIPKGGIGKVSVALQDITHEIDAISLNGEELPSFSQVQIVKKTDERTVAVISIK